MDDCSLDYVLEFLWEFAVLLYVFFAMENEYPIMIQDLYVNEEANLMHCWRAACEGKGSPSDN